MKVNEIMTKNPITIKKYETIEKAASVMLNNSIDGIPIVDDQNRLIGLFTKQDLYRVVEKGISFKDFVSGVMHKNVEYVTKDKDTKDMLNIEMGRLPVVDKEKHVIGIITKTDLLKAYYKMTNHMTEEFEAIFKCTHNGLIVVDRNGKVTNVNKSGLRLLGQEEKNVIGKNVSQWISCKKILKVLDEGEPQIGNRCAINGFNVVMNITPYMRNNKIGGAIVALNDITELQETVEKLNDEKHLTHVLRTILENAYDGIVVIDKNRRITMINNSYAKFLEKTPKQLIGKDVTKVIENTRLHIVLDTGEAEIGEIQKIGSNNIVAMRIPIRENEKVVGAIGKIMFRNLQELNSLAKKLNNIKSQLNFYKDELKKERSTKYSFDDIPEKSARIREVKDLSKKASKSNSTILIFGESGTGKELFAHSIHNASDRHLGPFVKMNCAAIPHNLLESELFGYAEGAFTGAKKGGKIGKFQLANGGTIFLDEIGDMSINMQAKLLRALQEKEIEPVGSNESIKIDARIISATNKDLNKLIEEGKFRRDLFYRLNVIKITVPPLRERKEDIEELVKILLEKLTGQLGKYVLGVTDEVLEIFRTYNWPGNVRELENVIERAVNLAELGDMIRPIHLPPHILQRDNKNTHDSFSLKYAVEDAEKNAIIKSLGLTKGNKVKAAKLLDISRSTLYEKIEKYGL